MCAYELEHICLVSSRLLCVPKISFPSLRSGPGLSAVAVGTEDPQELHLFLWTVSIRVATVFNPDLYHSSESLTVS